MKLTSIMMKLSASVSALSVASIAMAQDGLTELERVGKPITNGIALQPAVGETAHTTHFLDNILLVICFVISIAVMILLMVTAWKFKDRGQEPKRFTHNTLLEVSWTLLPVLVLVGLVSISIPALVKQLTIPEGDVTVKVVGYQWYWGYEYPEEGISFDSNMLEREELADYGYQDDEYLLATDTAVVVPINKNVIIEVTAADVIHSWKIPSFGIHVDAVPGRTALGWFNADKEGIFFGQCSELCGERHSYMPITVKVVSQEAYDEWLSRQKAEASIVNEGTLLASN